MRRTRRRLGRLGFAAQDPHQFPSDWRYSKKNQRAQQELHMWREWKESGESPEKLEPLLTSLQPIAQKHVNRYSAANVHRPAMEAHANQIVINSLQTYDPRRAQMNTHLESNLRALDRYTKQRQNFSRVTETRLALIGPYQRARAELLDETGRDPTSVELADKMKVSVKKIEKLQLEMKSDKIQSLVPETQDPFVDSDTLDLEVMHLLHTTLSPDELRVWEYMNGMNGKPQISKGSDIARKLGWSNAKVSQHKKAIEKKYYSYTNKLR